jgi:hypothetical protein
MIRSDRSWTFMPTLRNRCKVLSEIWGFTVFVRHYSDGYCELVKQRTPSRTRDNLTGPMKIEHVRAIVEWEIARAEGQMRAAV